MNFPYIKEREVENIMLTTWKFWKCALIRAIKTFAQTAAGMLAVGLAFADVDWLKLFSVAGVAAVLSILTSLAGLPEVDENGTN